jgi:hypothetical protein
MKNVRLAPAQVAFGFPKRLAVAPGSKLGLFIIGWPEAGASPHYQLFSLSQILPVWQGETPTAARPCNPRAAETVERPAAAFSESLIP